MPDFHNIKLVELNTRLNGTYLPYGDPERRRVRVAGQLAQDANAAAVGPAAARTSTFAARTVTKAGKLYSNASWDLVDAVEQKIIDDAALRAMPAAHLPDALKDTAPDARMAEVEKVLAARNAVRAEIAATDKLRQAEIAKTLQESGQAAAASMNMDVQVKHAVRRQATALDYCW